MPEPADGMIATCIDELTLAAFVDRRLTAEERRRIEAHLAECDDCYTLLAEVVHTQADLDADAFVIEARGADEPGPAPAQESRAKFRTLPRRRLIVATGGLLALAASAILIVQRQDRPLAPLVSIVGTERWTLARPTGGFRYGALRSPVRSSGDTQSQNRFALMAEEGRLREKAASGSAADVHAWGVSQLLLGSTAESIQTLASAVDRAPAVAVYHADLGAAYLTRFFEQKRIGDGEAGLASLDRALTLDPRLPEARFNRALLLSALGRSAAYEGWNDYLRLDADSLWADEARRLRAGLKTP